jgi:single-strand DNA-binding protein
MAGDCCCAGYVEGQLQTREWTDKDCDDRYSTGVVLQGFGAALKMPDAKSESNQPEERTPQTAVASSEIDDEILF